MTCEHHAKQSGHLGPLATRVPLELYDNLGADLRSASTNLYFISGLEWLKVGLANNPAFRLPSLQTGCPFKLKIAHRIEIPRAFSRQVERQVHRRLKAFATHGEWFSVDLSTAISAAEDIVRQVNAICSIIEADGDDYQHTGPCHTGADFIYLLGGTDFADKRRLTAPLSLSA